jgi:hypothetical protein
MCHAEKPEAGRFWASRGLSAGPILETDKLEKKSEIALDKTRLTSSASGAR